MADVREVNVELAIKGKAQGLLPGMLFSSIQLNLNTVRIRGKIPGITEITEARFESAIPKNGSGRIAEVGQTGERYALSPHPAGLGDVALLAKRIDQGIEVFESRTWVGLEVDEVGPQL